MSALVTRNLCITNPACRIPSVRKVVSARGSISAPLPFHDPHTRKFNSTALKSFKTTSKICAPRTKHEQPTASHQQHTQQPSISSTNPDLLEAGNNETTKAQNLQAEQKSTSSNPKLAQLEALAKLQKDLHQEILAAQCHARHTFQASGKLIGTGYVQRLHWQFSQMDSAAKKIQELTQELAKSSNSGVLPQAENETKLLIESLQSEIQLLKETRSTNAKINAILEDLQDLGEAREQSNQLFLDLQLQATRDAEQKQLEKSKALSARLVLTLDKVENAVKTIEGLGQAQKQELDQVVLKVDQGILDRDNKRLERSKELYRRLHLRFDELSNAVNSKIDGSDQARKEELKQLVLRMEQGIADREKKRTENGKEAFRRIISQFDEVKNAVNSKVEEVFQAREDTFTQQIDLKLGEVKNAVDGKLEGLVQSQDRILKMLDTQMLEAKRPDQSEDRCNNLKCLENRIKELEDNDFEDLEERIDELEKNDFENLESRIEEIEGTKLGNILKAVKELQDNDFAMRKRVRKLEEHVYKIDVETELKRLKERDARMENLFTWRAEHVEEFDRMKRSFQQELDALKSQIRKFDQQEPANSAASKYNDSQLWPFRKSWYFSRSGPVASGQPQGDRLFNAWLEKMRQERGER
ncbi:hypothetical protein BJ508DRAFT_379405 [Ascobolus immersus RN42]|uniref:Uncharacterized protein n=1 Tax=Ascobolus immersus RN42 TaxID=1160509 RepID=A0A3N4HVJ8_ASCIM|nr:hypothetical protein BJ508DRAFT_379405 [Ascobolus immersus RN42]